MTKNNMCACVPTKRSNMTCKVTPIWFINGTEYDPAPGTFELLICGEEAFGAVHRAIEAAKHSVSIMTWSFQPSMFLVRGSQAKPSVFLSPSRYDPPCIGGLLERKALEGVKVRVLCWDLLAIRKFLNTPRPWRNPVYFNYDMYWYENYKSGSRDDKLESAEYDCDRYGAKCEKVLTIKNLELRASGFTAEERKKISEHEFLDKNLTFRLKAALTVAPSHHQKMVLIDVESPEDHVGFLMGSNFVDTDWDTRAHSWVKKEAYEGRNAPAPYQDLSSRITGPLVGNMFYNFEAAWKKEGGEIPGFPEGYFNDFPFKASYDNHICGHLVRTQSQYGVRNILKTYLHVVKNASHYIYIENQYFRWPPLADAILASAQKQANWERDPAIHGPLYLFVVTGSDVGPGSRKSHEMLDKLGRPDVIPGMEWVKKIDDIDTQIRHAEMEKMGADMLNVWLLLSPDKEKRKKFKESTDGWQSKIDELKAQRDKVEVEVIHPEERPGLKIHVCSLVAPDTPDKEPWVDVKIHSKVMLINDAYMTIGTANINNRSMEVDSEMNLCHCRPEIAQKVRQELWNMHTKGRGKQDDMEVAFNKWADIISKNKELEPEKKTPTASLRGFMFTDTPRIFDGD